MKGIKLLTFFFISILLINCSKNENAIPKPTDEQFDPNENEKDTEFSIPEPYFTLKVDQSFNTNLTDNWVIIHDNNGKILDYSSFENGEDLVYSASHDTITGPLVVNILNYSTTDGNKYFSVKSLGSISIGTVEDLGTDYEFTPNPATNQTGNFEVFIDQIPANSQYPFGYYTMPTIGRNVVGITGSGASYGSYHNQTLGFNKFEGYNDYVITILDVYNNLKYYDFSVESEIQGLNLNYNSDFKVFDDYLTIEIPEGTKFTSVVLAFDDNQSFHNHEGYRLQDIVNGYNLSTFSDPVPTNPYKIGYLDKFNKYAHFFHVPLEDNDSYHLIRYGSKPEAIEIPEKPDFEVRNTALQTFIFNTEYNYFIGSHNFGFIKGNSQNGDLVKVDWQLFLFPNEEIKLGNLPDEITANYPDFDFSALEYKGSNLYQEYRSIDDDPTPFFDSTYLSSFEYITLGAN